MKISKLTASYLAGLIDGEGYIGILQVKKGNKKDWFSNRELMLVPTIKVCMTNKEIITWLKNSFGGTLEVRKAHGNARKSYGWALKKQVAIDFIKKIYPYLMVKRQQAEHILRFPSHIVGLPMTDEVYNKRVELSNSIRTLNQRGSVRD